MTREDRLSEIISTAEAVLQKAREVKLAAETYRQTSTSVPAVEGGNRYSSVEKDAAKLQAAAESLKEACARWLNYRDWDK